jgi:mannosyltransferase OCH1-like enzyme
MTQYFADTIEMWRARNWQVVVWNAEQCNKLVEQYPQYSDLYHNLARNIQRADFIRYLIVFDRGGYYCDLDCRPGASPIAHKAECVYFVEHVATDEWCAKSAQVYPIRESVPESKIRMANYFFGAVARHNSTQAILDEVVKRLTKFPKPVHDPDYYVLFTTGPSALTRAVQNFSDYFEHKSLYYIEHLCTGTWRNETDRPR